MGLYDSGWGDIVITTKTRKRVDPAARAFNILAMVEYGAEFGEVLRELKVHTSYRHMTPLCTWLQKVCTRSDADTPIPAIISIVCPDYATEIDPRTSRRLYTFEVLGNGVGLVAQRALKAQEALWAFFRKKGRPVRFIIAMADQEAYNEENCRRVGLSQEEFLQKVRDSHQALTSRVPRDMLLETPFLTEMEPKAWEYHMERARVLRDNPGSVDPKDIQRAVNERRRFYQRWAGKYLTESELSSMVLSQASEYAAVGAYLRDTIPDVFILAADSPVMAPFMRLLTGPTLPLLYLERESYH